MPNYPEPGNLANANGVTFTGVAALPGGVVYGRDGQVIREMLAATSAILVGDPVILAPSLASVSPYFVGRTTSADDPLRYGIVVGGQVSVVAASAASQPVWVAIEGPAWARAGFASMSLGDIVGTASVAGQVARSIGANRPRLGAYGATVSFAGSLTSTGGGTYYIDVAVPVAAPYSSLDTPIAFVANASLAADLQIGTVWSLGSISFGVRMFGTNVSTTVASQASIPGTVYTAVASQPGIGAGLGVVLTSTSISGVPFLVHVTKG